MYKKILEIEGQKILCSLNQKYVNKSFNLSSAYRIFKKNIEENSKMIDIAPPYTVLIEVHTRKDIDNTIKAVLDALQCKMGNDNQVLRLFVDRIKISKKNAPEKIIIFAGTKNDLSFLDILKKGIL